MSSLTRFRWVCLVAGICFCGCAKPVEDAVSARFPEPDAASQSETVTLAGVSVAEEAPASETATAKVLEAKPEKVAESGESRATESQDDAPATSVEAREATKGEATTDESSESGLDESWPMAG